MCVGRYRGWAEREDVCEYLEADFGGGRERRGDGISGGPVWSERLGEL